MLRHAWWLVFVFPMVGCSTSTSAPRCVPGAVVACPCSDSLMGAQSCGSGGTFGACTCDAPTRCIEGALFACACPDGAPGAQACNASGTFGACDCEVARGPGCLPGAAAPCACESGAPGSQVCGSDEVFEACMCDAAVERCVPGRRIECGCEDSTGGTQTCSVSGTYDPCECPVRMVDGGVDAGVDAAPPICDPYAGEACGCREATPTVGEPLPRVGPSVLATGTNVLVDIFAIEAGIVVVDSGGARLLSRAGVELARWTSVRQVVGAAFDGTRFALADRGAVTSLDSMLRVESEVFVTESCVGSTLLSCGRLVCAAGGPAINYYVYDLPGRVEVSRVGDRFGYASTRLARVPGVEAFVQSVTGLTYFPVDSSGAIGFGRGSAPVPNDVFAFAGRPATHLITSLGSMLRLDVCLRSDDYMSGCLEPDGTLGTLRGEQVFLAMDSGIDGDLYAVVAPRRVYGSDDLCAEGCAVQRIDIDTRVVVSERPLGVPLTSVIPTLIRHDPWGGRVILGVGTGCEPYYYGVCTGWSVSTAAFD